MLIIGSSTNYGAIQEEFETQYLIGGRYIHKGLVVETNELSIDSIISQLKHERGNGYLTLYHGTDVDTYNKILQEGKFGDGKSIHFFTKDKKEAKDYGEMKARYRGKEKGMIISFKLPKYAVNLNSSSGEYETEFLLELKNNVWYPVINIIKK